jgi:hypothetical protein
MSSLPRAIALGLLALSAAGCELVFGLGDYARDGSGVGGAGATSSTVGSAGGADAASGGGASTSSSSAPSGGGGDGSSTASSSGSGVPAGCQCLPEVPSGWDVVVRSEVDASAPLPDCLGGERAVVGAPSATCTCQCAETDATCEGAMLRCWEQDGCTGPMGSWTDLGTGCLDVGERRSCDVVEATPNGPTCSSSATLGDPSGDALDLCAASSENEPACPDTGLCATLDTDERICVRGTGDCPDGWTNQVLEVQAPGEHACDACSCGERDCSPATYRMSYDGNVCELESGDLIQGGCTAAVTVLGGPTRSVRAVDLPVPAGDCVPELETMEASYVEGAASRLCCLAAPPAR